MTNVIIATDWPGHSLSEYRQVDCHYPHLEQVDYIVSLLQDFLNS